MGGRSSGAGFTRAAGLAKCQEICGKMSGEDGTGDPKETGVRKGMRWERPLRSLSVILACVFSFTEAGRASEKPADASLGAAICPIVYPVHSPEGLGYVFFGNAFFINDRGYLLTAAHVLKPFRSGGQPHILVSRRAGQRQLLPAAVVALDSDHDVAVLRAGTNPFEGEYEVAFLPLSTERPAKATPVASLTLWPSRLAGTHIFEPPREELSAAEILDYQQTHLGAGQRETELLLFSGQVLPGQSGAPLLLAARHEVVGILVGGWLRNAIPYITTAQKLTASPGAALRIHYALTLLREHGIAWQTSHDPPEGEERGSGPAKEFSLPMPISLVAPAYPRNTLFGSEVLLDAVIDTAGKLASLRVVRGEEPFLEKALEAVRMWKFLPARLGGPEHGDDRAVEAHLGIVFQFPQPRLYSPVPLVREHEKFLRELPERGALPAVTREPQYPPMSIAEGSVAAYVMVDRQGRVTSVHVLHQHEPLTAPVLAALRQWRFMPGREARAEIDSAAVVVGTFRRPVLDVSPGPRRP
jgi:hypothetical protein